MKSWRRYNIALHRDLGYFFSALTIVYCLSGLALNHIDAWNPDFIIHKEEVRIEPRPSGPFRLSQEEVLLLNQKVGEERHRLYDYPTPDQVKVYYEDGSLHLNLATGVGQYEKLRRRPIFYEANVIHRNTVPGWKWAADIFAIALIVINLTGLVILRGRYGIGGRGKWLIAAGAVGPAGALLYHAFF